MTILELIFGVTILSITLAIGVPSFTSMMRNNRLAGQVNEFVTALNYARSEAYKRGVTVSVCATNTSGNCVTGGSWANGWLVIEDVTGNGDGLSTGDTVLQRFQTPAGGFTYAPTPATGRYIGFRPLGIRTGTNVATSVEIYKSGCSGPEKRLIRVGSTGRVTLERTAC